MMERADSIQLEAADAPPLTEGGTVKCRESEEREIRRGVREREDRKTAGCSEQV